MERAEALKIDPLFFDNQRAVHDTSVDIEDILPKESYEEKLHGSEDCHHDKDRRHSGDKPVPPDELHDQIYQTHDKAKHGHYKPEYCCQPQSHLGVRRKAEHSGVI